MSSSAEQVKIDPNGNPVRHLSVPNDVLGKLRFYRWEIARRAVQITILLLFFGTVNWDWAIAGLPVLTGNLSSSTLLGIVPLGDPYASLQIFVAGHTLEATAWLGALIVLLFWGVLAGRTWCSWACPINMVTDAAASVRSRFGIRDALHLSRNTRYVVLVVSLVVSVLVGVAAFEWVSPISLFHRELIYGIGLGWTAIAGIFFFDLFILRNGWCGRLCPLGAFYALLGKVGQVRVTFDTPTCTHCGDCIKACPEPQVLNLKQAGERGLIVSGECTNCARCITVCPEDTLKLQLRTRAKQSATAD